MVETALDSLYTLYTLPEDKIEIHCQKRDDCDTLPGKRWKRCTARKKMIEIQSQEKDDRNAQPGER